MNTLELAVMSPHDGGTHLEWGVEGRGWRLPQILSDESLSYSFKQISTGKHSLHISWRSTPLLLLYFHDDVIKRKYFPRCWLFVRGIHRSPVDFPNKGQRHWAMMFSLICAWTNGWVNNQDAGDLRRHRTHFDVTVMWCRIVIQWSAQPRDLSVFNASLLSIFELVNGSNWGGGGGGGGGVSVHNIRNCLKFATLLYPDYHSLEVTIFCTQQQFKFVVSDHPHICLKLWWKQMKYTFFVRMNGLHAMPITDITHSACYTVEMGVSARYLTRITLDNNHTAYMHICRQGIGCVYVKN